MVVYVKVFADELHRFTSECFVRYSVPKEDADIIADHLVLANLRGVDSHGIIRIPVYIEGIKKGYVKPFSKPQIIKETAVSVLIDGGGGLGIPIATKAIDIAIEKCRSVGLAVVGVRNLGHVGMLAYYTLKIARNNLIGLAAANGPALVAPWGGAEPVFGTNPISIAFPTSSKPIVIDMATSAIASFKIRLAALKGEKIPEGVALTKDGKPTTDPKEAHLLLPFGGYKGYAIALTIEILSGILVGGLLSKNVINHGSTQGGFFVLAIDPTMFREYNEYLKDIDTLTKMIKSCKPAQGFNEILLPGEPEDRIYEERLRSGIPIDINTWKMLTEVAKELNIELPKTL
uniref:Ldh family oxidoreductase n=1 Tax=Ignisphaera aggregans TaxID=334771 RepID=A0A7C5XJ56_9CREN